MRSRSGRRSSRSRSSRRSSSRGSSRSFTNTSRYRSRRYYGHQNDGIDEQQLLAIGVIIGSLLVGLLLLAIIVGGFNAYQSSIADETHSVYLESGRSTVINIPHKYQTFSVDFIEGDISIFTFEEVPAPSGIQTYFTNDNYSANTGSYHASILFITEDSEVYFSWSSEDPFFNYFVIQGTEAFNKWLSEDTTSQVATSPVNDTRSFKASSTDDYYFIVEGVFRFSDFYWPSTTTTNGILKVTVNEPVFSSTGGEELSTNNIPNAERNSIEAFVLINNADAPGEVFLVFSDAQNRSFWFITALIAVIAVIIYSRRRRGKSPELAGEVFIPPTPSESSTSTVPETQHEVSVDLEAIYCDQCGTKLLSRTCMVCRK